MADTDLKEFGFDDDFQDTTIKDDESETEENTTEETVEETTDVVEENTETVEETIEEETTEEGSTEEETNSSEDTESENDEQESENSDENNTEKSDDKPGNITDELQLDEDYEAHEVIIAGGVTWGAYNDDIVNYFGTNVIKSNVDSGSKYRLTWRYSEKSMSIIVGSINTIQSIEISCDAYD